MLKIAVYGKGGIGKSTTVSNLSCSFSRLGLKVMQIGCDPKADSTRCVMGGVKIPTVLDTIRSGKKDISLSDIVFEGWGGVLCAEAGGPTPGRGCAGKGIVTAFEQLKALRAFETFEPDVVMYDVLGDVVCGGFSMPLRGGYADTVYIVTSGEMMSLYAADNICRAVREFSQYVDLRLGGLILNHRNIENENDRVETMAKEAGVDIFAHIPRSSLVQEAEDNGTTVAAAYPESEQAKIYLETARRVLSEGEKR